MDSKGETLHDLRRYLAFGSRRQLPADEDDQQRHALCLQLLVNAVLIWNPPHHRSDRPPRRTRQHPAQ